MDGPLPQVGCASGKHPFEPPPAWPLVRQETKEWLLLMGKSALFVLGGILIAAGLVDLVVDGFTWLAGGVLALGLLLAVPPLAFSFRDAYREARKGHRR